MALLTATKLLFYDVVLFYLVREERESGIGKKKIVIMAINGMWCFVDLINMIITGGIIMVVSAVIVFF